MTINDVIFIFLTCIRSSEISIVPTCLCKNYSGQKIIFFICMETRVKFGSYQNKSLFSTHFYVLSIDNST